MSTITETEIKELDLKPIRGAKLIRVSTRSLALVANKDKKNLPPKLFMLTLFGYNDDIERISSSFYESVKKLCEINHPNILKCYGCTKGDSGNPALLFEYVDGVRLDNYCRRIKTEQQVDEIKKLTLELIEGVQELDKAGIEHLMISQQNALVDQDGRVKIFDPGLFIELIGGSKEKNSLRHQDVIYSDNTVFTYASEPCKFEYTEGPYDGYVKWSHGAETKTQFNVFKYAIIFYELLQGRRDYIFEVRTKVKKQIKETITVFPFKPLPKVAKKYRRIFKAAARKDKNRLIPDLETLKNAISIGQLPKEYHFTAIDEFKERLSILNTWCTAHRKLIWVSLICLMVGMIIGIYIDNKNHASNNASDKTELFNLVT